MKSLKIETATIADAVNRAARVSPERGPNIEKFAGVQIDGETGIMDDTNVVSVTAMDGESSFYWSSSRGVYGDESFSWRLPAKMLSGFISGLPMTAGAQVHFSEDPDEPGIVTIEQGNTEAKLRTIPEALQGVHTFDPAGMQTALDFARRVQQVSWAVGSRDRGCLAGVRIDGKELIATDTHKCVAVPCEVPIDKPVTVPMMSLAPVLRNVAEVRIRATSNRLEIMPDVDTKLTTTLFTDPYPNVEALRANANSHVATYRFVKERITEPLERMLALCRGEEAPKVSILLMPGQIALEMNVEGVGGVQDSIDVEGGSESESYELLMSPVLLMDAVKHGSRESVHLGISENPLKPVHIWDESGYDCWAQPMRSL